MPSTSSLPFSSTRRLPRAATVVDFAYAVHTDIGNRCVAAKIDRRLAPLRTVLRNGQTVQIITAKGATPNPSWVGFVVTAKARTAIRHYLKSLRRSEAIELGRQLLNEFAQFDHLPRVEAIGGLVENQQIGRAEQSQRNRHALPKAARELASGALAHFVER
jgi:(p)ppGpp synthase/HD superfamily hydrolase